MTDDFHAITHTNEQLLKMLKEKETELERYKTNVPFILAKKVYNVLEKVSKERCTLSIFGDRCLDRYELDESQWCVICLAKKVEKEIRNDSTRAGWRNHVDDLDTYYQALYAIRAVSDHLDLPGKKANAKRRRMVLAKMVTAFNDIRKIAAEAIQTVKE